MIGVIEENTDTIESKVGTKRPRVESLSQSSLKNIRLDGLYFISKVNHRNRSFIPSTKNYFGGIQIKKVLCDTGCSTILLPLEENQLHELFSNFSSPDFIISIGGSENNGGDTPVLKICHTKKINFDVKLCQDLVGNDSIIQIKFLRFSLCSEDVNNILGMEEFFSRLTEPGLDKLRKDQSAHLEKSFRKRRSHALLGQSVLKRVSSIRFSNVEFFVDSLKYLNTSWDDINDQTQKILEQIQLPSFFDDWEDDDNLGLDDSDEFDCDDEMQ